MEARLRSHITPDNLENKIYNALEKSGLDINRLRPKDLVSLDHLFTGDRDAFGVLLEKARIDAGAEILDAGCGIGSLSRILAQESGHIVTGVDPTGQLIRIAKSLTEQTMLSDQVYFHHGTLMNLPFRDDSFDAIFCRHLLTDIRNKQELFDEFFRVLKGDGKLLLREVVKGEEAPLHYPVPWADKEAASFIESWETIENLLTRTGFEKCFIQDVTPQAAAWWQEAKSKVGNKKEVLGPGLLFGNKALPFGKTMTFNFKWNRTKSVQAVFRKKW